MDRLASIENRLTRIETKMIRGFEELGADTDADPNWLTIYGQEIHVTTLGRSLMVLLETAKKQGADIGKKGYVVVHKGRNVAWL